MYSIDIDGCPDAELDYVIDLLISERDRRERATARFDKAKLAVERHGILSRFCQL